MHQLDSEIMVTLKTTLVQRVITTGGTGDIQALLLQGTYRLCYYGGHTGSAINTGDIQAQLLQGTYRLSYYRRHTGSAITGDIQALLLQGTYRLCYYGGHTGSAITGDIQAQLLQGTVSAAFSTRGKKTASMGYLESL